MRQQDPNDFQHIGGQGLGIHTLQLYLKDTESDIARIYDHICKFSSTQHLFPVRGKQFYLGVAAMHASYIMMSSQAQETRINKLRSALGPSQSRHKKSENQEATTRLQSEDDILLRQPIIPAPKVTMMLPHDPETQESCDAATAPSCEISLYKAKQTMAKSRDEALASTHILVRQPVIRGKVKTLDDYVKLWTHGVYRGIPIRKLRQVQYRKDASPPITNTEWRTEKHAVKRLYEAVNIVAHFLPGNRIEEGIPTGLWNTAVEEAYRALGCKRGRKTSMRDIKSSAKAKGICFKCEDPRLEGGQSD